MKIANLNDSMKRISELQNYQGEDEVITSWELRDSIKDEPGLPLFYSKFPSLDRAIKGFEPGELIAVSGPRKSGKTLFAQTLTHNFDRQSIKSLWFSYELLPRQLLSRFKEVPLFVMPKKLKPYAPHWLQDRTVEALTKHGIQVVFIDHLHFLFDMARSRNTSVEIGQIIRWLKSLAIELNLVIFILCHLQKIGFDVEPDDSNIRDSSFVSQESDTGLILWRVRDSEDHAWLKVCYSRRTGTLEKKIPIVKVAGLLREAHKEC